MDSRFRVIKIGGSLLGIEDLGERLRAFQNGNDQFKNVFLVGGGQQVEIIRDGSNAQNIDDRESHRACLEIMASNLRLVSDMMAWPSICNFDELCGTESKNTLFDVSKWSPAFQDCTWDTTSDSLAAILAQELEASELVLLKPIAPPTAHLGDWIEIGYVDGNFGKFASSIKTITVIDFERNLPTIAC